MMELRDGYGMLLHQKKKYYLIIKDSYIIDKNKKKVALAKKNVLFDQIKCTEIIQNEEYCKVSINNFKGYIAKKASGE